MKSLIDIQIVCILLSSVIVKIGWNLSDGSRFLQFIRISICKMSECWICSYSLFQEVIDLSSRRKIAQPWNFWHNSLILNLNFYVWTLKAYTPNIQNRYLHFYILWKGGEQRSCRRWQVLPRTQGKWNRKEIPENSVKKSSSCIKYVCF